MHRYLSMTDHVDIKTCFTLMTMLFSKVSSFVYDQNSLSSHNYGVCDQIGFYSVSHIYIYIYLCVYETDYSQTL